MAIHMQQRRDTAANWANANPVLADGEFGFETDTRKLKCGDGVRDWLSLPYLLAGIPVAGTTGQVLAKTTNADYDTTWETLTATNTGADPAGAAAAAQTAAEAASLQKAANLGDVPSPSTARTNLGLGTVVTHAATDFDTAGAAAAAQAASDPLGAATSAQAASLQKTANLSDVANAGTSRTNLGLGSAATHAATDFDASGAAATVQTTAEAYTDTQVSSRALDSAVVHNTGNETVAGVKTFSSAPTVPDASFTEAKVANLTTDLAGKQSTWNVRAVSASTTAVAGDVLECDATSGAITITMPAATAGARLIVKKIDASANAVTVTATVDGTVNPTLVYQYGTLNVVADGTNWIRSDRHTISSLVDWPATSDARYARPRAAWTGSTVYAVNDIVEQDGSTFRCVTAHTSSAVFQSQFIVGFWERWAPRSQTFDVRDYGAKVDASTDDTAAVQAAINACYETISGASGGGIVYIPPGYGQVTGVELKNHVWLKGAGMFTTTIRLIAGSNTHVVKTHSSTNGTTDPNAEYCGVSDLTVDGRASLQTGGTSHGIFFNTNPLTTKASADAYFDSHHYIHNVHVYTCQNDGIHIDGRSASVVNNAFVESCNGNGIVASFDTVVANSQASLSGLAGFSNNTHGSVQFNNCKSYLNGTVTPASGCGFLLTGSGAIMGVALSNCVAQNNQAQGFYINGQYRVTGKALVADTNSQSGDGSYAAFEVNNAQYCDIEGISVQSQQTGGSFHLQTNALRLTGGADKNRVALSHSTATGAAAVGAFLTSDSTLLTNMVIANGAFTNPAFELQANKGQASGYASLGGDGLVPSAQLPPGSGTPLLFGNGFFGDGSDGTAVLDGTNTFAFLTKAGNVYTLQRDTYFARLTVSTGCSLRAGGFRIFCSGLVDGAGTIQANGNNAAGATAGAAASAGTIKGGTVGATGTTGAGANGTAVNPSWGGSGGNGGTASAGATAGGTGGVATVPGSTQPLPRSLPFATTAWAINGAGTSQPLTGGAPGASGAGDGTFAGGGGGSSGAPLICNVKSVAGTVTFSSVGGNGANGVGGNAGGGGGGGGGVIVVNTTSATGQTLSAAGGTHGSASGTGSNGADGSTGATYLNVWA